MTQQDTIRRAVARQQAVPPSVDMAKVRAAVEGNVPIPKKTKPPVFKSVAVDTALRGTIKHLHRGCSGFGHPSFLTGP